MMGWWRRERIPLPLWLPLVVGHSGRVLLASGALAFLPTLGIPDAESLRAKGRRRVNFHADTFDDFPNHPDVEEWEQRHLCPNCHTALDELGYCESCGQAWSDKHEHPRDDETPSEAGR